MALFKALDAEITQGSGTRVRVALRGLRNVITFQGVTVPDTVKAFEESVDDYLAFCAERGESPEKPFSGKFLVRLTPDLHRKLAMVAASRRTSLNALVEHALATVAEQPLDRMAEPGQNIVFLSRSGTVVTPPIDCASDHPPKKGRPPKRAARYAAKTAAKAAKRSVKK